jgi:hypothetical protein
VGEGDFVLRNGGARKPGRRLTSQQKVGGAFALVLIVGLVGAYLATRGGNPSIPSYDTPTTLGSHAPSTHVSHPTTTAGSDNSIADAPPSGVAAQANAAIAHAGSVHVVITISAPGFGAVTYTNDVSRDTGTQTITSPAFNVSTIAVPGTVYLKANQTALSTLFNAPPAAQAYADQWLAIPSSDPVYNNAVKTLTLPSLEEQIMPTASVTESSPTTVGNKPVIGLQGDVAGGGGVTLYVASSGAPLPVQETIDAFNGAGSATAVFSNWGETVSASAPSGAVPASQAGL